MDDLSYADFCQAHDLPPLASIKKACEIANVRSSKFYEMVKEGVFVLVPNGRRRNVTALNLYQHHCALVAAARAETE
jgi:hypothetical protein